MMKKQKICIIGGSLTGLVTAISLSKLNCEIDLITGKNIKKSASNATIAISENNLEFLKKLNISKTFQKKLWPSSIMKIYTEKDKNNFSEIFELNHDNKLNKILYVIKNIELINLMWSKIKKIKSISIIKNKNISDIPNSNFLKKINLNSKKKKYNLVIICAGNNSDLVKNIFDNQTIKNSYNETSITAILNHDPIKNNIARQIFLDNSILALLPISKKNTSIVWSVKKILKRENNTFLKKQIQFFTKNFLNNIKFTKSIEFNDLNFLIRKKYYKDRILLFGDALHVVHPFVGQGFNMVLRDLKILEKILENKIKLGLDIGSLDILSEFSDKSKPNNFAFSIGIDVLKTSFSINNKFFKELRNNVIKNLNKNTNLKNVFFNIANKGLRL